MSYKETQMSDEMKYSLMLDEGAQVTMARLQRAYGLENKAAVYDLAVRVLNWVAQQQLQGYEVGRCANEEFQPLVLPNDFDRAAWVS